MSRVFGRLGLWRPHSSDCVRSLEQLAQPDEVEVRGDKEQGLRRPAAGAWERSLCHGAQERGEESLLERLKSGVGGDLKVIEGGRQGEKQREWAEWCMKLPMQAWE